MATRHSISACSIKIRGVVQGVGFRPFVLRLAQANTLTGWVLNGEAGVDIFVEGDKSNLETFVQDLKANAPPAAQIAELDVTPCESTGFADFTIRGSRGVEEPIARISPDLPVCEDCLRELFDPADRRFQYPYINCTNCGPRYSILRRLPYDRKNTAVSDWPLDDFCAQQYGDVRDRRFHAQPVACHSCGPAYCLRIDDEITRRSEESVRRAAELLRDGKIVAVKGIGGYHLACDAKNATAVQTLRERKFRKEKPFAIMVRSLEVARSVAEFSPAAEELLLSTARPIVLAAARLELEGVAPGTNELGVMLPYTPLHYLLFAFGAPEILVMTSANRSSEPIAYEDSDAFERLAGIADGFLVGERPIVRRVDDSVARAGVFGPMILRRSRGYAPGAVAGIPTHRPILAVGADLKNTITLAVCDARSGMAQAFTSQHIGDLADAQSQCAFGETIEDLLQMYRIDREKLLVLCDGHPQYRSTIFAAEITAGERHRVQHHRAHIASVLAERGQWEKRVLGVSFDGTGYGDDGTIWGGEFFAGSVHEGFRRVAHLRPAALPGGNAAAQFPLQAAAGFLDGLSNLLDFSEPPFSFPERFQKAYALVRKNIRVFKTTSVGRLFDAAAALLGFTRGITFEGQAAIWLEQLALRAKKQSSYPFPFDGRELDFRPLLTGIIEDRLQGRPVAEIARAFQYGFAQGTAEAVRRLRKKCSLDTAVLSGGVFQNELLLADLQELLADEKIAIWTNHKVPPNDGGISLGQAALGAFGQFDFEGAAMERAHA